MKYSVWIKDTDTNGENYIVASHNEDYSSPVEGRILRIIDNILQKGVVANNAVWYPPHMIVKVIFE